MSKNKLIYLKEKLSEVETYLKNQSSLLDIKSELFFRLKTLIIEQEDFVLKNEKDFLNTIMSIKEPVKKSSKSRKTSGKNNGQSK